MQWLWCKNNGKTEKLYAININHIHNPQHVVKRVWLHIVSIFNAHASCPILLCVNILFHCFQIVRNSFTLLTWNTHHTTPPHATHILHIFHFVCWFVFMLSIKWSVCIFIMHRRRWLFESVMTFPFALQFIMFKLVVWCAHEMNTSYALANYNKKFVFEI